jgi:hypothetical protein
LVSRVFGVDVDGLAERRDLKNDVKQGKRFCAEGEIGDSIFEAGGLDLETIFAAGNIVDVEGSGAIGCGGGGELSAVGEQTDAGVSDNGVGRIKDGARDEMGGARFLRILIGVNSERKKRKRPRTACIGEADCVKRSASWCVLR